MTKVIRVKDDTFEALIKTGKWTETMNDIVTRLVKNYLKELHADKGDNRF